MLAIGAVLGGLATGAWGIYPAFIVDLLTFLFSAYFIYHVRYTTVLSATEDGKDLISPLFEYIKGLRDLKDHFDILAVTFIKSGSSLTVSGAFQVIQVIIAEQYFVIGEGGGISLGIIYMMVGIGTGFGPILARVITRDRHKPMRTAILVGFLLTAVGIWITSSLSSFPIVLLGVLIRGFGVGINWVFSTQLLLLLVPNEVRGREFSTEYALLTLGNAAGAAIGGWYLDAFSRDITGLMNVMTLAVLVPALLWGVWNLVSSRSLKVTG